MKEADKRFEQEAAKLERRMRRGALQPLDYVAAMRRLREKMQVRDTRVEIAALLGPCVW